MPLLTQALEIRYKIIETILNNKKINAYLFFVLRTAGTEQ